MKNKRLLFGILLVFLLLTSMGLTYAYFSVVATVEGEARNIETSTGTLSINYNGGAAVTINNVYPGDTITKTFTVENTGSLKAYYEINWKDLVNTIENDELTMSGTCTGTGCETIIDQVVETSDYAFASNIGIEPGITHTYTLVLKLIETSQVQNYNQGKNFFGTINIKGSEEGIITLQGTLLDTNNDPIPNATLTLHSDIQTTTTDSNGRFEFSTVDIGTHTISAVNSSSTTILSDSVINLKSGTKAKIENNIIIKKIASNTVNVEIKINNSSAIDELTMKGIRIAQASAGGNHTLAIDTSGNLWAWGYNSGGQLGNGTTTNSSTPIQIKSGTTFSSVSAGINHTLAIDSYGFLFSWGSNEVGQLGNSVQLTYYTPSIVTIY